MEHAMWTEAASRACRAIRAGAGLPLHVQKGGLALAVCVSMLLTATLGCMQAAHAAELSIHSPEPGENVRDNSGKLIVVLALEDDAELPRGLYFRLLLDGKVVAADVASKRIALTGINRGTYELEALIVDTDGNVLARSQAVSFTMRQASRLNPAP